MRTSLSRTTTPAPAPAEKPKRSRAEASRERRGDPLPEALSYTVADAVRISGIGRTTLYAMMAAGHLRRIKLGSKTLVHGDSLRALLRGPARAEG